MKYKKLKKTENLEVIKELLRRNKKKDYLKKGLEINIFLSKVNNKLIIGLLIIRK